MLTVGLLWGLQQPTYGRHLLGVKVAVIVIDDDISLAGI